MASCFLLKVSGRFAKGGGASWGDVENSRVLLTLPAYFLFLLFFFPRGSSGSASQGPGYQPQPAVSLRPGPLQSEVPGEGHLLWLCSVSCRSNQVSSASGKTSNICSLPLGSTASRWLLSADKANGSCGEGLRGLGFREPGSLSPSRRSVCTHFTQP